MSTSVSIDLDKLGRASRRSAIVSGIGLFIVLASLGLAVYKLYTLQDQISTIQAQKDELTAELEQTKVELEQKKSELNKAKEDLEKLRTILESPAENLAHIIKYAPYLPSKGADRVEIVKESFAAGEELTRILNNPKDVRRRGSVTVRYYVKEADGSRGETAMGTLREKRKFKTDIRRDKVGEPDTPTNAIWPLSPKLSSEDIKLVAYTLIRLGIQIRYIGDYPDPDDLKSLKGQMMIMIGADRRYKDMQIWTVDRIRDATSFK